ncbi:hypothetical protein [Roseibium sediminis]|uniref:hypothetical protein n=1 Tax=Roseibium sediminis TaxID=1775174 RepID=UPI00123D8D0C|nr:hypothetical protein [Roseibium sediminis]
MQPQKYEPVTITWAKDHCTGIEIHCMKCAYMEIVGFDGYGDSETIPDLPKSRTYRCPRCGSTEIQTRPRYPQAQGT